MRLVGGRTTNEDPMWACAQHLCCLPTRASKALRDYEPGMLRRRRATGVNRLGALNLAVLRARRLAVCGQRFCLFFVRLARVKWLCNPAVHAHSVAEEDHSGGGLGDLPDWVLIPVVSERLAGRRRWRCSQSRLVPCSPG